MSDPLTKAATKVFGFDLNSICECEHDLACHTPMVILAYEFREGKVDTFCRCHKCECKKFVKKK